MERGVGAPLACTLSAHSPHFGARRPLSRVRGAQVQAPRRPLSRVRGAQVQAPPRVDIPAGIVRRVVWRPPEGKYLGVNLERDFGRGWHKGSQQTLSNAKRRLLPWFEQVLSFGIGSYHYAAYAWKSALSGWFCVLVWGQTHILLPTLLATYPLRGPHLEG